MSTPRSDMPQYQADEEHDGERPHTRPRRQYREPDQPGTDPESGSGVVDFADGRPAHPQGNDAPSGNSA